MCSLVIEHQLDTWWPNHTDIYSISLPTTSALAAVYVSFFVFFVVVVVFLFVFLKAVWCSGCDTTLATFHSASHQPHKSTQLWLGTWQLLGCKFKSFFLWNRSRWDFRCPHHLHVRKGLFSGEFPARLQELCLHRHPGSARCASIAREIFVCVCDGYSLLVKQYAFKLVSLITPHLLVQQSQVTY